MQEVHLDKSIPYMQKVVHVDMYTIEKVDHAGFGHTGNCLGNFVISSGKAISVHY